MLKVIMFDLDGTLLPMDMDTFIKAYFKGLAQKMAVRGYDPKRLVDCVWGGTDAMVRNDGSRMNEDVFWEYFTGMFGQDALKDVPVFEDFYNNEFDQVEAACGKNEKAAQIVHTLQDKGYRLVLATNPLFPEIATRKRMGWAGLKPSDFEMFTTYENAHYCKPNPNYYKEILEQIQADPKDCLMVGNDVDEDMIASTLGMKVFLLTDCLINKHGADMSGYPQGGFDELLTYINKQEEEGMD